MAVSPEIAIALALAFGTPSTPPAPSLPVKPVIVHTTCGCDATRFCTCFESKCGCSACGLGGSAGKVGKSQILVNGSAREGSQPAANRSSVGDSIQPIPAKVAVTPPGQEPATGLFNLSTPTAPTTTSVKGAVLLGGTSGCASGNCPTGNSYSRSGLFGRKR